MNQAFSKIWIVVILIVLVIGGILVYQYWPKGAEKPGGLTKQEKIAEIKKEMIQEAKKWPGAGEGGITEETAPEIIEPGKNVEGWATYKNEEAGYQVNYLANWIIMRRQFSNCGADCKYIEDLLIQNLPYVSFPGNGPENGSVFEIRIFEISSPTDLTIRSWIENADLPTQQKEARINHIKTMEIAGAEREVSTGVIDVDWQQTITFVDASRVYELTYFSGSAGQFSKDLDIFKQMLSTFKFTSNWQTYRNEKKGFELKYPKNWTLQDNVGSPPGPVFSYRSNDGSYCQFDIVVTPKSDNSAEMNWYRQNGYKETEYNVAGIPSVRFTKLAAENKRPIDVIYFTKDQIYRISLQSSASQQENCVSIFNQILSTFKFTK